MARALDARARGVRGARLGGASPARTLNGRRWLDGGFQPVPFLAVYAATKAFVLSFSEALWAEYRPRGVRVVALCAGATDTPFFARAGEAAAFGPNARPEDVVRLGLRACDANRASVVHGAGNRVTTLLSRFVTRELTAKLTARLMRPCAATAAPHLSTT